MRRMHIWKAQDGQGDIASGKLRDLLQRLRLNPPKPPQCMQEQNLLGRALQPLLRLHMLFVLRLQRLLGLKLRQLLLLGGLLVQDQLPLWDVMLVRMVLLRLLRLLRLLLLLRPPHVLHGSVPQESRKARRPRLRYRWSLVSQLLTGQRAIHCSESLWVTHQITASVRKG